MKKLIITLVLLSSVFFVVNANSFFSDRYFEVQTSVPVNLSNNVTSLNSILKKEIEIDLQEFAQRMPKNGLVVTQNTNPMLGFNLNLPNFFIGVHSGFEINERFTISKGLFDLVGEGYSAGETCIVQLYNDLDIFYDLNIDVGFEIQDFLVHVKPTFFIPLASVTGDVGSVTFQNDDEGNLIFNALVSPKVYTAIDYNDMNVSSIEKLFGCMGFDLGGSFEYPIFERHILEVNARIPIVPGRLTYMEQYNYEVEYKSTIQTINDADVVQTNSSLQQRVKYLINRPLKLGATMEFDAFSDIIKVKSGLGFGVSHPFVDGAKFYPEYLLGVKTNLANIIKTGLSTEYTDRVFKNQFTIGINVRVLEIECGVSLQAANFAKSFTGSGLGAFVVMSVGY